MIKKSSQKKYSDSENKIILRLKTQPQLYDALFFSHKNMLTAIELLTKKYVKKEMTVIDIGCGTKPYRSLFPKNVNYIGVDCVCNSDEDVLAYAWKIPLKSQSADIIFSTFSLEHINELDATEKEISRLLKKNGQLFITVPFVFPEHETPYDYWRFTRFGVQSIFKKYSIMEKFDDEGYLPTIAVLNNLLFQAAIKEPTICKVFFIINNATTLFIDKLVKKIFPYRVNKNLFYYALPLNNTYLLKKMDRR